MSASPLTDTTSGRGSKWNATDAAAHVHLNTLVSGELQQLNRLAGGAICNKTLVTADVVVKAGPALLYGIVCITAGTMAAVYDNTSAAGTIVIPSQALTAGQMFTFGGIGVSMDNGIFADWTSGSFLVLWV